MTATGSVSRVLALETLCGWQGTGQPIRPVFERFAERLRPGDRDRHLALTLVQGVLRRMQALDHVITHQSTTPLSRLDDRILMALRLGIFQLLFLDRVPESAAVNETVRAFKRGRRPRWQSGFVNGVLRGVARNLDQVANLAAAEEFCNHPEWMVKRWRQRFGRELTRSICRATANPAPLTLRINTLRCDRPQLLAMLAEEKILATPCRYCEQGVALGEFSGSPTRLPGFAEGLFQVQGEAAQLVTSLLPVRPGGHYLDGCAGLGGKTGHLAERLPDGAALTAVEPDPRRFALLEKNLNRLGLSGRVRQLNTTLQDVAEDRRRFDGILLDVPCSGTGVTGRQPDIRWNRRPGDIQEYSRTQLALLETAAGLLNERGVVVYATCSLEEEENEGVVDTFLRHHREFELVDARQWLPDSAAGLVGDGGFFAPTPADHMDGFFGACLRRK